MAASKSIGVVEIVAVAIVSTIVTIALDRIGVTGAVRDMIRAGMPPYGKKG